MNNSYLQMFIWNYCPTACRQLSYASKSFHFYLCIKFRRIKCLFINRRQDLDRKKTQQHYFNCNEQCAGHLQILISKSTENASSANIAFQHSFRIMIFLKD